MTWTSLARTDYLNARDGQPCYDMIMPARTMLIHILCLVVLNISNGGGAIQRAETRLAMEAGCVRRVRLTKRTAAPTKTTHD